METSRKLEFILNKSLLSMNKIHQGRNFKRFRELLGIKQEALAFELGEEWSQKKVSLLEQKEIISTEDLMRLSEIFQIPLMAFLHMVNGDLFDLIISNLQSSSLSNNSDNNELTKLKPEQPDFYINFLEEAKLILAHLESTIKKAAQEG
ncbi:helix-turn-helix domain-containing protein [Belliella sp. DSM 111904]|uniref:Helix-turn-helix domain-containing protein n=1 Tax=Belliella filtrata TaxID=2923435 RepID=A0ABS9V0I7_9BACT|nr:helix-turn-helix transcriptional regulator [Belliella filtrata]MCH7409931.1 helix-turn-helix domain-containing protein [Belliella filtrata]